MFRTHNIRKWALGLLLPTAFMLLTACNGHEKESFDIDLIVGKWVAGSEYYRYDADHTGVTWDTDDDVTEEEAQPYNWEFDNETNKLTLLHQMEMGAVVPKYYTMRKLNTTTLEYDDNYGQTFSFSRVD